MSAFRGRHVLTVLVACCFVAINAVTNASIRTDASFFAGGTLDANDDGSTGSVNLGLTINFLGATHSNAYINNNGNITFDAPLSTFTPFNLQTTTRQIVAPFFADVDTRNGGSGLVHWGNGTVNGRNAFAVTWGDLSGGGISPGVGYYATSVDKLNEFQLVLIDRSDIAPGDFDIEFNYDQIQWETGGASGGINGLGGASARVGFSNGSSFNFELAGSAINGAFLDGGPNSLVAGSNVGVAGRYVFEARNGGIIVDPGVVPEPGSFFIYGGLALCSCGAYVRRQKKAAVTA